jgi:small-conductance mechanosensitive channel
MDSSANFFNLDWGKLITLDRISTFINIAILIFIGIPLCFFLSKWIRKYVTKKISAQQGMIFSKVILYSGITIIIMSVLYNLNFKLAPLLGAAGIVGIAIGFASQTSVSNIISGLFLMAEKPFEVDDIITISDTTGIILSIDLLSIKLRTFDNKFVRIPNETIIKSEVINVTRFPVRRIDLQIGVAYKEDIAKVKNVLFDIAKKNPLCLNEPKPLILFQGFGNSSIDLLLLVWATKADWLNAKNSIFEEIKKRFDEEGIEIPFPHLSLYSGSVTNPIPVTIVKNDK